MSQPNPPHLSILSQEFLSFFEDKEIKVFVDGTLGAGGHSLQLLEQHPEIELLIGIDQDASARELARERLAPFKDKVKIVPGNFSEIEEILSDLEISHIDGAFLDIGVSSMQIDQKERGFSFQKDAPLDMRMDQENNLLTCEKLINESSEKELATIFYEYGEESRNRAAAKAIVEARYKTPIRTTFELCEVLRPVLFQGRIHFATKVFQALRIKVNDELGVLQRSIPKFISCLNPEGRFGVITFHSLEDRIVKNSFRECASKKRAGIFGTDQLIKKEPLCTVLTKKPLVPSAKEQKVNKRSRSAKMRFIQRL